MPVEKMESSGFRLGFHSFSSFPLVCSPRCSEWTFRQDCEGKNPAHSAAVVSLEPLSENTGASPSPRSSERASPQAVSAWASWESEA